MAETPSIELPRSEPGTQRVSAAASPTEPKTARIAPRAAARELVTARRGRALVARQQPIGCRWPGLTAERVTCRRRFRPDGGVAVRLLFDILRREHGEPADGERGNKHDQRA